MAGDVAAWIKVAASTSPRPSSPRARSWIRGTGNPNNTYGSLFGQKPSPGRMAPRRGRYDGKKMYFVTVLDACKSVGPHQRQ
jgi:hypothetical protein